MIIARMMVEKGVFMKIMKFKNNRIIGLMIIGLLCLVGALVQAEEQPLAEQSLVEQFPADQSAQAEQIVDPVLSEQEIFQYLQNKFKTIKVAPDVNEAVIARTVKGNGYTRTHLENGVAMAQKLADEDGSDVISRQHMSAVINNKVNTQKTAWLIYALRVNRRAVAVHESGHAVAMVHLLKDNRVLTEVSMIGNGVRSQAFTQNLYRRDNFEAPVSYFINLIIMPLSGGIAEQIFGLSEYTKLYDFIRMVDWKQWFYGKKSSYIGEGLQGLLSDQGCSGDVENANKRVQFLLDHQLSNGTKDEILQESYDHGYQFILDHKDDVEKLSDLLMQKDVVFGEEVYELLGVARPLFDFEEVSTPVVLDPVQPILQNKKPSLPVTQKRRKK